VLVEYFHPDSIKVVWNRPVQAYLYVADFNFRFKTALYGWFDAVAYDQWDPFTVIYDMTESGAYWWKIFVLPLYTIGLETPIKYPIGGTYPYARGWD
jgi:hypothetical protein